MTRYVSKQPDFVSYIFFCTGRHFGVTFLMSEEDFVWYLFADVAFFAQNTSHFFPLESTVIEIILANISQKTNQGVFFSLN